MTWAVSAFDRVPQESGPPLFNEVGPIMGAFGLSVTDVLSRAQVATFSLLPDVQSDAVKALLRKPGTEYRITRNAETVFAGPIIAKQSQQSTAGNVIACQLRGLHHYFWRRIIPPDDDLAFDDVDQVLIAKSLIDSAQADAYSDFGVDTSGMTASGVLRDRTYKIGTIHVVGQRVEELAALANGFDFYVDPQTRAYVIGSPQIGTDLSGTVILTLPDIADSTAAWSQGIEDLVSHAFAVSTSEGPLLGERINLDVLTSFGRADIGATYLDVTRQETIDGHADELARTREAPLFVPTFKLWPINVTPDDFFIGDSVGFDYDYGLGPERGSVRIIKRMLSVGDDGVETIAIEVENAISD